MEIYSNYGTIDDRGLKSERFATGRSNRKVKSANKLDVVEIRSRGRAREQLPVPLAHTLRVRAFDVLFNYLLPTPAAQPAPEETLNLLDFLHFNRTLHNAL